jgi:hypothetical protein
MAAEQIFERPPSDLVKGVQQLVNRLPPNWFHAPEELIAMFRQRLNRLYVELARRAESEFCEKCAHYIRWWEQRVAISEHARVHRSCWEGHQIFLRLVSVHLRQSEQADFIASRGYRSLRIGNIVGEATDLDRVVRLIESIVSSFHDEMQRSGKDSPQTEYARGLLGGAKAMLAELCNAASKEQVLRDARQRVAKPFPCALPLASDGNRYGWDPDSDG